MNYKLKVGEELPDRVRQILRKQIRRAASVLADHLDDHREPVHEARKWLKKVRAMLRLVKPALGEAAWQREDRRFRRIARTLARRRDAEVLSQTVDKLRRQPAKPETRVALTRLRRRLASGSEKLPRKLRGKERKGRAKLRSARRHVRELPLEKLGWRELARGVRETYQAGAVALATASQSRAPHDLHEWRKRVKDLWYQLRVLEPIQRERFAALAEDAKQLSLRLGDDHDLFLVENAATGAQLDHHDLERILELVHSGRRDLQEEAIALGRRMFAETPEAFTRRLGARPAAWAG